jgi:hypothetical protein
MPDLLHTRSDFNELLAIVADQRGMDPVLVEKDYWIMHCLWGLQASKFRFELKGGTSLSKGFGVIHRFSEDIDIRIEPPDALEVKVRRNDDKPAHVASRRAYYEWLSQRIAIPGIEAVERDTAFDDEKMRSAGIRLRYPNRVGQQAGIKDGILLELGFDDTTPNRPVTISSWAYDAAVNAGVQIYDNRAVDVLCYLPTYTFVEKLQTVSTKYRLHKAGKAFPANFMRHYYDLYCLLTLPEVQKFIGTSAYEAHKVRRFRRGDELVAFKNPAFLLEDRQERARFASAYQKTSALYYNGQPDLEEILARIRQHIDTM